MKNQKRILEKLKIPALNDMQQQAQLAIHSTNEVILLSPTGTGKTIAFLLPIIQDLEKTDKQIRVLILVPSRELAIQIEQVAREMGTGYKVNAIYGGRSGTKDRIELKHAPSILIGTPGRIADHIRRGHLDLDELTTLVLDEFDKSLETGFEKEMMEIIDYLPDGIKKVLTSATFGVQIPAFVRMTKPLVIDFLEEKIDKLDIELVESPIKDKTGTLVDLLRNIGSKPGIIFCNFKDTIQFVSDALDDAGIVHGKFYGGLEQQDRERALIKFRNGTHLILLATDLAARGLDIPELSFIIHYQMPFKEEEFTHRNGRTARMHSEGTAYVLYYKGERLKDFIPEKPPVELDMLKENPIPKWSTLFISGGRKDKISKGDIAGFMIKEGGAGANEVGVIELKQDCAFVSILASQESKIIQATDNKRLKKKKVRVRKV